MFYDKSRTSFDLDIMVESALAQIIKEVSYEIFRDVDALSKHWMDVFRFDKRLAPKVERSLYDGANVRFLLPVKDFILGLKLISVAAVGRRTKDLPDIYFLMGELKITNREGLLKALGGLPEFKENQVGTKALSFLDEIVARYNRGERR